MNGLVERCLVLLDQSGMSKKAVWTYKQYGFNAITHQFIFREITDYSKSEVDSFMVSVREAYENGDIQEWKWQKIRKASVFLESIHKNDTLDLTPMLPWAVENNPLHKKPKINKLEDKSDIFVLVYHVKCELQKLGLSQDTIKAYTYYGFDPILRYYIQRRLDKYNETVLHEFSDEIQSQYAKQEMREDVCRISRKAALLLEEYYMQGIIQWRHQPSIGSRILSAYFSKTWDGFCTEHEGFFLI